MSAVFAAADAARSPHSDPTQAIYIVLAVLLVIAVLVMLRMSGLLRARCAASGTTAPFPMTCWVTTAAFSAGITWWARSAST